MAMPTITLEVTERMLVKFDGTKSKLFEFLDNSKKAMKLEASKYKDVLFTIIETKVTDT